MTAPQAAEPDRVVEPGGPAEAEGTPDLALAEMRDRWQRAVAEVENARRRFERQLSERAATERARVAAEWLPVLDNVELALSHAAADPQAIIAGIAAIREQALAALARLGITPIEDQGRPFDPARHEAVRVVTADVEPGTVVAVVRPGYAARDRLLRPAAVVVAGDATGEHM